jgi:hypothetical protein
MLTAPLALLTLLMVTQVPQEPALQEIQEAQEIKKSEIDYSKEWNEVIIVPDDIDLIKEKALPYIPPNAFPSEFYAGPVPDYFGMRTFCVMVNPKKTVRATLKATPIANYAINYRLPNTTKDPMYNKLKSARAAQGARQAPFLEFKNTTAEPYPFVFFVIGYEDNPYSITLKRSK